MRDRPLPVSRRPLEGPPRPSIKGPRCGLSSRKGVSALLPLVTTCRLFLESSDIEAARLSEAQSSLSPLDQRRGSFPGVRCQSGGLPGRPSNHTVCLFPAMSRARWMLRTLAKGMESFLTLWGSWSVPSNGRCQKFLGSRALQELLSVSVSISLASFSAPSYHSPDGFPVAGRLQ